MYLQSDVPAMVYSVLSFRSDVVIKLTKTVVSKRSAKFVSSILHASSTVVTNSHVYYIDLCYATFSHAFAVLFVQDTP